jgi:hypothetical protein
LEGNTKRSCGLAVVVKHYLPTMYKAVGSIPIGTHTQKKVACWALVAHACNPETQEAEIRKIEVRSQPGQIVPETLSQKHPSQKRGWWSGTRHRP